MISAPMTQCCILNPAMLLQLDLSDNRILQEWFRKDHTLFTEADTDGIPSIATSLERNRRLRAERPSPPDEVLVSAAAAWRGKGASVVGTAGLAYSSSWSGLLTLGGGHSLCRFGRRVADWWADVCVQCPQSKVEGVWLANRRWRSKQVMWVWGRGAMILLVCHESRRDKRGPGAALRIIDQD
jgi:hypothetical protein